MSSQTTDPRTTPQPLVETWSWARTLFASRNPVSGTFWLIVRVLLGWQWLEASLEKFGSYGPWRSGAAVQGFAKGALAGMKGAHPSVIGGTFGWNKAWLQYVADGGYRWIGPIIPFVELTIGTLLVLGLLMNVSFLFGGSAGVNPAFALTAGAIIAAGYYGLDNWVLPLVGVPWSGAQREHRA